MGIIRKQAIVGTILTYIGLVIGFVTTALIFPKFLTREQIGLIGVLLSYSMIFAQLSSLGFANTTTFFFPLFRQENRRHHGFLFLVVAVTIVGCLISWLIFLIVKPNILENSIEKSALFIDFIHYIIPLTIFIAFFNAFDQYYKMLYNTVIGITLREVILRIFLLVAVCLFVWTLISFNQFILLYIVSYLLVLLLIIVSLLYHRQFNLHPEFGFLDSQLTRRMASVSLFGIISSATMVVSLNLDRIMIDRFAGLGPTGVYTTMYFFGSIVIIPSRSLTKISSTIIADAFKINDLSMLRNIYYKSSLNQFVIGLLILIGIWGNIDNVYRVLPATYIDGKFVVLIVGFAYLVSMAMGVNFNIISNSKYYRIATYFLILTVIGIVLANVLLIPLFGITGSALSFLLVTIIISVLTVIFVKKKFNMFPFNFKYVMTLLFGLAVYFITSIIPFILNVYVDVVMRSLIISVLYILLIFLFRISEDINERIIYVFKRFLRLKIDY
jgi:O-antigen/teichoic acid export membrane protein